MSEISKLRTEGLFGKIAKKEQNHLFYFELEKRLICTSFRKIYKKLHENHRFLEWMGIFKGNLIQLPAMNRDTHS